MGLLDQKIRIETVMVDNVTGQVNKINKSIKTMTDGTQVAITNTYRQTKAGLKLDKVHRQTTTGVKKFQGQYLSLMFTAMAVNRVFGGIVKSQMELWGISELLSATIMIVMIPVMEWLLELLLPIFEWFMNLPDPAKKVIGIFVVLTAIISGLVMIFAMFALAITSITLPALLASITIVGMIIAVLVGLGFIFVGIIGIVKNWGIDTVAVMKNVGLVIMGIGFILLAFIGWWALIPIAVGAAVYLIFKYWDQLPGWLKGPIAFIVSLVLGFVDTLKLAYRVAKATWEGIKAIFKGDKRGQAQAAYDILNSGKGLKGFDQYYWDLMDSTTRSNSEMQKGMGETVNVTDMGANKMESTMKQSLESIQGSFSNTTNSAIGNMNTMETDWSNMSNNNLNVTSNTTKVITDKWAVMSDSNSVATADSVNSINQSLSQINPYVKTIHETVEITSKGSAKYGGYTNSTPSPVQFGGGSFKPGSGAGRAIGGNVSSMTPYIVGERGPELFIPGKSGSIIPNNKLSGSGEINYSPTYNVVVADKREFENMIKANNSKIVEDLKRLINI